MTESGVKMETEGAYMFAHLLSLGETGARPWQANSDCFLEHARSCDAAGY